MNCKSFTLLYSVAFTSACSMMGEGGLLVDNSSRLLSSMLASTSLAGGCGASSTSCTPTNLQGRIYSGSIMLGSSGSDSFAMTVLAADEETIQEPHKGSGGEIEFNLKESTLYSGKAAIPEKDGMPDNPIIEKIELNFDYLDATVVLTGTSGIDGTYIVRTVFGETAENGDVSGEMSRGDLLVRAEAETAFKWCNATTCSATRGDVKSGLIQDGRLSTYESPGQGNPFYAPYAIELKESVTVTHAEISDESKVWQTDFDLENAIGFSKAPSTFTSVAAMVSAFSLKYAPSRGGAPNETGITATFDIVSK
jgi:hypothetical protein